MPGKMGERARDMYSVDETDDNGRGDNDDYP